MSCKFRLSTLLQRGLFVAILLAAAGGCQSPQYHKAEADKEAYRIIDNKWQDSFGQKANYKISDAEPSPNDIQTEKAIPSSGVITLAQAVATATAHNREYQTRKETLYLKALDLTLERHNYARRWFATIDGGYTREGDDESVSIEGGKTDKDIGFEQTHLLADGALIATGIALDWARFFTGDPYTTLASVLSARAIVPLLGAGAGKVARENLTQAERDVLYRIRSFNRYRKTFVVTVVARYYSVLQKRDAVTNAENNYKRVSESKERLEAEAAAGRKPQFEVDQAEQNMLRARDSYVRTQQEYQQLLDEFKIRLALPTDANIELDQNELQALEEVGISEPDYTLDAAIETALLSRLDLANSMDYIDDAVRNVMLAADGLGTQLNFIADADVHSPEDDTDFSRLQFHKGTYGLGLEADLPLDRKAQRNAYRRALITLEQVQRQYDNYIDQVKLDVRQAYRQLREAAELYQVRKNSLELAQRRVESTTLLLDAGRAKTRDLLESQDALLRAQNDITDALVAHVVAKLNFFQDVGILQVRPDGMWEQ